MTQQADLAQASQLVSDFYQQHFNAYHAATPGDADNENCDCVSMEPKDIVLQFLESFRATTDNHHTNGELCQHPFGTAVTKVSTAVINALEALEYPRTYGIVTDDPTPQSDGIRAFTRQTFKSAFSEYIFSSFIHCHQCAHLSTEQLFQQVKNGFGKSVDSPHGDDTVCSHPTHHANRRLILTIYLGMDQAQQEMPRDTVD